MITCRCGAVLFEDDYSEDGVCAMCLLAEITEELGLYENQSVFAENQADGFGLDEGQKEYRSHG